MSKILKLKMILEGINPQIWRTIEVGDFITFEYLHFIIQTIMSWDDYHLYCFNIGKNITIDCNAEEYTGWNFFGKKKKVFEARNAILSSFIKEEKEKFLYTYDFGDNWNIEITVESITPKKAGGKKAICLAGKRNAPPEDSGGTWGYANSLEILRNKEHPGYEDTADWYGEDFDSEYFNVEEINKKLN